MSKKGVIRSNVLHLGRDVSGFNFFGQFKLGESYTSLILGMLVVIVASVLLVIAIKGKRVISESLSSEVVSNKTVSASSNVQNKDTELTYSVTSGDTLWDIAEEKYKSGYRWVEIARTNNLSNPDYIFVDSKLKLPKIQEENISAASSTINGSRYVVQTNDYLWDIAVRAYGDGFRWVEIARINNLSNPDLIFAGDILKIPR